MIDEEIAWQLFGSSDVAEMEVTTGGATHYMSGVIRRQCDSMEKKAGADEVTVLTVIAVILCVAGYRAIDRAVKKWWRRQKMYS